ncbi:MAG: 23S rRNA (guanosine(2251)-2'-O)-methyltransferase RlmB [Chloroflexi bacterium]|nr:23S rRNA (guanosine(2251)-2'-O)-methyltransferase RlmB [Chloroflexota bacterium]
MKELLTRRNTVLEALRARRRPLHTLWVLEGAEKQLGPILHAARQAAVSIRPTTKEKLGNLTQAADHQGVALEVGEYPYVTVEEILAAAEASDERPFILILDLVQGTQNVGALLRTAEICGVHGVIMQERRSPDITPQIAQHAVGATEHLRIARVTNLGKAIEQLKAAEVWVAGLDMGEDALPLGQIDLNRGLAIVVGNEGEGLRRLVRDKCDFIVRLPMRGRVESLNASVAGSVMLYMAWQARGFSM